MRAHPSLAPGWIELELGRGGLEQVNQWDVIVAGGGISGLAAAALLAHAGRRVLVLERRPVLGGRAMVVRQGGFTRNYGYHFVLGGSHSPHSRVLRRIGRNVPARATHVSRFCQ